MGCDIHTITEVRTQDGWKPALLDEQDDGCNEGPIFDYRNYALFGFLADVRNYSDVKAMCPGRGFPDDATDTAKALLKRWNGNAHSATYVTLAELLSVDYSQPIEDRRVTRQIAPNFWDGGCTAEPGQGKLKSYEEFLGRGYFDDIEKLKTLGKPEDVRVLMFFGN